MFRLDAGLFGLSASTDLLGRAHGVEHARDDLSRPGAAGVVSRSGFQQFGVRKNDPQLIVQPVEQHANIRIHVGGVDALEGSWVRGPHSPRKPRIPAHACCPAAIGAVAAGVSLVVSPGSRQSESAKILMEPPAVRTYSTLPAEIQL